MNIERLKILANALDLSEDSFNKTIKGAKFNMDRVVVGDYSTIKPTVCNTTCCIAGIACLLFGDEGKDIDSQYAARLLDLTIKQKGELFFPIGHNLFSCDDPWSANGHDAANAIKRLIERDTQ